MECNVKEQKRRRFSQAGDLCQLPNEELIAPNGHECGHECRGGCGGHLHGLCGEVEDSSDTPTRRICHTCISKRSPSNSAKRKEGQGFLQPDARKKKKTQESGSRKRLSFEEKLEIIKLLDSKVARPEVARRFGCGITAIASVKREKAALEAAAATNARSASSKSARGGDFPKIDRYTMELVETARVAGLPVIRSTIQTFGVKARDAAVAKAQTDEDRAKYEGFTASIHWAKNFIVRNNLSKTRLRGLGDEGSVDATLGRQDPPREEGVRNGTDEGGPGDGGHPAPEEEEEEEQKNALDEEDPNNKSVADPADGPTSRPNADAKKAERGAGGGARRGPVPPPYSDVADYFGRLEATAVECAMDRVSHFLRLAKMEWIDEFEKRKGRQTDIRDFLSSK